MKQVHWICSWACVVGFALSTPRVQAQELVGSAFTYQGSLMQDGEPVDDLCDFEFRLWDDGAAGSQVGVMVPIDNKAVSGGQFTAVLDFGSPAFAGHARWLEIAVRCPAGVGAFTTLNPRQELTPTPYAIGLSLPYAGDNDAIGNAFSMTNTGLGRAGNFSISNAANTSAALNAVTVGTGPAGRFLNDSGGTTLIANNPYSGTGVHAEIQGTAADSTAIYSSILHANAGLNSSAVRGENQALVSGTYGVWGSSAGSGRGVYGSSLSGRGVSGVATADFGFGVHGLANGRSGIGVYGIHPDATGDSPGVDGVTHSIQDRAAGVRGRATMLTADGTTFGVLGQSTAITGVGVRGESNTGVEGVGQQTGVYATAANIGGEGVRGEATYGVYGLGNDGGSGVVGEAGNSSTFGVWAIGAGGRLGAPALRADGGTGPAIYALGSRAIEGEGTEFGIRGVTWEENGVGGTFTNYGGGLALRTSGDAKINGTMTVDVLEIMGGADLAERFRFSEHAEPGMVVAIDPDQPGKLRVSREAYNKRVAGVISGANSLHAGVVLGNEPGSDRNLPVALTGRVWVLCDTRQQPVEPGDLMTTSDLPGHAMPVADGLRSTGAIIGKAMTRLAQGERGMVLVLVNLQ